MQIRRRALLARVNAEINAALQLPDVRERMLKAEAEPLGGDVARLQAFMKNDDARYGDIPRRLNLRAN